MSERAMMDEGSEKLLTWPDVQPLVGGLSRVTVWRMVGRGDFPKPVTVSPGRVAWRPTDIAAWQNRNAGNRAVGIAPIVSANAARDMQKANNAGLRDRFAMSALQGLLTEQDRGNYTIEEFIEEAAELSYRLADAMMKARHAPD